jgi:hypothetical protein
MKECTVELYTGTLYCTFTKIFAPGCTYRVHRVAMTTFLRTVHHTVMVKLAQPGEGGGCTPSPFHSIYNITSKVVVYAPAEMADTLPLFLLYTYVYSVDQPASIGKI